jgi:16S rRNA (guanine527-N7)-methyltransferase
MTTLSTTLAQLQLPVSSEESLHAFTKLFLRWNRAINLSAARSEAAVHEHIIDCLHVVPHLHAADDPHSPSVLDVGAGGGFPAIIAAICLPQLRVTALEPLHKKLAFLRTAARELALHNLEPIAVRLADHPRRGYDASVSRATFDLPEWLRLGRAYVRPGGVVLGFEAVPRDDLPAEAQRHPYTVHGKSRAIISLRLP